MPKMKEQSTLLFFSQTNEEVMFEKIMRLRISVRDRVTK